MDLNYVEGQATCGFVDNRSGVSCPNVVQEGEDNSGWVTRGQTNYCPTHAAPNTSNDRT